MGYPWALLNAPFRRATDRFFRHIEIDEAWRESVQSVADRGPLIYVLRNVSVLDYLALDHLTHRFDLPRVGFANELPPAIAPGAPNGIDNPSEQLRHTVVSGGSAALFLKRAPQRSALAGRGRSEGAALLETLISLQCSSDHEIMMMPQTFVWTMRPERRGFSLVDNLFGPAEFPGELRMATQFLLNYKNCRLRAGDPLSLGAFLHEQGIEQQGDDDDGALVRRLTYALLRKVERERRTIVGPAHKPPDRLREEVLRSPKLQSIVGELAGPAGEGRATLTAKAREMLHEMQTIPDAEAQRNLALVADQVLTRVYAGVDVDEAGLERLRELRSEGAVVLLPSHKSHIDYVVLSYVLRKNGIQIPVIAAGDNLSFFPAGPILRRCGAFFIRRKFRGDRLYTAVVDAYMRRLMRDGWLIEIFLEGGRSRTGKLLQPMLGLLNMVVASALSLDNKRVFFVPVAIGYERLMEEGAFTRELSGGEKRPEDATELLKIGGLLAERFGSINLQFGEPLELSTLREDLGLLDPTSITPAKRRAIVKRLAHQVMSDINRVMALTPGSLVALVLLSYARRGVSYADLLAHCRRVTTMLLEMGARAAASLAEGTQFRERGIRSALDLYVKSRLVKQHVPGDTLTAEGKRRSALYTGSDVIFTVPDDKRLGLDLAKNHIVHWLVDRALVSVALLYQEPAQQQPGASEGGLQLPMDNLRDRVQSLSRLFKYEFMFRADASFDEIFDDVVADMVERGELRTDDNDVVALGPGRDGLDGLGWVTFHATAVRNFLEAYRITARGLAALVKGPLERKDLVARTLRNGARMFLQGEVERSEAVSGPVVDNALSAFVDQGYLVRQDGKLALADSFASAGGVATIEGRISVFLRHRGADEPWS
jgi:glycerol-3-phosphate O-acyltransferase